MTINNEDIVIKNEQVDLIKKFQSEKFHPYLWSFKLIDWFIFGSLTWEREGRRHDSFNAQTKRAMDFNNLIRAFCGKFKLRQENLSYYYATEYGESGEAHFHFLIAKDRCSHLNADSCCEFLKEFWECKFRPFDSKHTIGAGTAAIMPYQDEINRLAGYQYCLKRERDDSGRERERYDHLSTELLKLIGANN